MHQQRVTNPFGQLFDRQRINPDLCLVGGCVFLFLLNRGLFHFTGIALFKHIRCVLAAGEMQLYICMIALAVILLHFQHGFIRIYGFPEEAGNVLLQPFIRLGTVSGKGHAQMTLIEHLAPIFIGMLTVAHGQRPDRPHGLSAAPAPFIFPENQRMQTDLCFSGLLLLFPGPAVADILPKYLFYRCNSLIGIQLRPQFNILQQFPVHLIRKTAVLPE